MEIEIKANLPFSWCRNCESRALIEEKMYAGGKVYESRTICENAPICENAEKARKAETAAENARTPRICEVVEEAITGQPARGTTELMYPWCEGFQGCKTCEDDNRGHWPCCPIVQPKEWYEPPKAIGFTCRHCGKTLETRRYKITEHASFMRCPNCNEVTVIKKEE